MQEADTVVQMPSGELMVDAKVAVDQETLDRMYAGRICINCFEPLEFPFPEVCNALKLPDGTVVGCYYRVRARQLIDLQHRVGAGEEVHIGSRVKKADEVERMREHAAYEDKHGIILPNEVKFPQGRID